MKDHPTNRQDTSQKHLTFEKLSGIMKIHLTNMSCFEKWLLDYEVVEMSKKTLYKLFYADQSAFKAEYDKRFHDENTIHLDIKVGEHSAFICESADIFKLIISIERTNNLVNQLCNNLPGIALSQFQQRCLIDEIVRQTILKVFIAHESKSAKFYRIYPRIINVKDLQGL